MLRGRRLFLQSPFQWVGRCYSTAAAGVREAPTELHEAKPYSEMPGPKPLPLIGNIWRFLPVIGEFSKVKPKHLFSLWRDMYGPVMKMTGLPGRPDRILISDAGETEKVFRNDGPWPLRDGAESMTYYFKHHRENYISSLITTQGEEWQELRSAVQQVMMVPRNVKMYFKPIERVCDDFLNRVMKLRDINNQMPDNFKNELQRWSMESTTYVALDTRLGALEDTSPDSEPSRIMRCVRGIFEGMYQLDIQPSIWKHVTTPTLRKYFADLDEFILVAEKYVNQAIERLKALPEEERETRQYSVLERILLSNDDPSKGISMALDMIFAGVDSTSASSAAFMYQMAKNPDKQRLLHEELDRVIPDPHQPLSLDMLEQLKYLRACIKETLRTNPVFSNNMRTTGKDLVIGGYHVPKGTQIMFNSIGMALDDDLVPRAKEFLPERWLPGGDSLKPKNAFAYLPFGFGPRMCVGKRFAELQTEVMLSKFFRRTSVEWHHPHAETELDILLTYHVPLKFTVIDRV